MSTENLTQDSWDNFRSSGLLWFVNQTLHLFGWVIVLDIDDDSGEVLTANVARTKYRGFSEKNNTEGYIQVSEYLKDNVERILEESKN